MGVLFHSVQTIVTVLNVNISDFVTLDFFSLMSGGSFQAEEGGLCIKECTFWSSLTGGTIEEAEPDHTDIA